MTGAGSTHRYTPEQVWYEDGGVVTLNSDRLRRAMSRALSKIPASVADYILKNCLLLMIEPEEGGTFLPNRLIRHSHLLAFPHSLLDQSEEEIDRTILHEVAHCWLGHRWGLELPQEEDYEEQEKEAWAKVDEWLGSETKPLGGIH